MSKLSKLSVNINKSLNYNSNNYKDKNKYKSSKGKLMLKNLKNNSIKRIYKFNRPENKELPKLNSYMIN